MHDFDAILSNLMRARASYEDLKLSGETPIRIIDARMKLDALRAEAAAIRRSR